MKSPNACCRCGAFQWIGGGVLAAAISSGVVWCVMGRYPWMEVTAGWGLALLNAVGATVINRMSVGPGGQTVPLRGIVLNVLRVIALVTVMVIAMAWLGKKGSFPFLVAMFSGYFVFLSSEIVRLYQLALRETRP